MGIPAYFSHIIKNYPSILKNITFYQSSQISFHSLYMDCNSIIYDSLRKITEETVNNNIFEQHLIQHVIQQIEQYIQIIQPTNVLYIAFDGVAPLAKMEQQRQRRYKSVYMKEITDSIQREWTEGKEEKQKEDIQSGDSTSWNTNAITPGTLFMQKLSYHIRHAFLNTEQKYKVQSVVVSTSEEPGEGEHKMFHHIRTHIQPHDNIVVYGLDSDLIMLSLFHYNLCNNIYIFKETPEYMKKKEEDVYTILDIQLLFQSIVSEMACDREKNRAYDYIFLCFFVGNDFLPHFPSLNIRTNGISILLDCYRKVIGKSSKQFIISNISGKIQWKNVAKIIKELAKYEKAGFIQQDKYKEKLEKIKVSVQTPKEKMELLENTPIFYRHLEKYICPSELGWEDRYYKALFHEYSTDISSARTDVYLTPSSRVVDSSVKKQICLNYLEGLEWTFKYYTEGCPNWKWKYNYHYPPLFQDLQFHVPYFETDLVTGDIHTNQSFHPNVQLSYVLPIESHSLIDERTREILHAQFSSYYTRDFQYEWAYCRYLWESHLILPEIPLEILNEWNILFTTPK